MTALPGLTLAIASHGARFLQIDPAQFPSPVEGVRYHIFAQCDGADPATRAQAAHLCARADIAVSFVPGRGVARNRNAAIAATTDALLLFADDDLTLFAAGHAALRRCFAAKPDLDFLCGRLLTPEGLPRKTYGADGRRVTRLNAGRVGTPELALRLAPVRAAGLRFDEAFGAGTAQPLGDEYIFLCDALAKGLRGEHRAIDLASHPAESSGSQNDAASFTHRRAAITRALGPWAFPALCAFALKHRKRFPDGRSMWRFLVG